MIEKTYEYLYKFDMLLGTDTHTDSWFTQFLITPHSNEAFGTHKVGRQNGQESLAKRTRRIYTMLLC